MLNPYIFLRMNSKFIKNSAAEGITASRAVVHHMIYSKLGYQDSENLQYIPLSFFLDINHHILSMLNIQYLLLFDMLFSCMYVSNCICTKCVHEYVILKLFHY
jgi:hypothetical protein